MENIKVIDFKKGLDLENLEFVDFKKYLDLEVLNIKTNNQLENLICVINNILIKNKFNKDELNILRKIRQRFYDKKRKNKEQAPKVGVVALIKN